MSGDTKQQYTLLPASSLVLDPGKSHHHRQERRPRYSVVTNGEATIHSDRDWRFLSFVESKNFHYCQALIVALNVLVMAGQTDDPDFALWWYADNVFMVIYVVEIVCRLLYLSGSRHHGHHRSTHRHDTVSAKHLHHRVREERQDTEQTRTDSGHLENQGWTWCWCPPKDMYVHIVDVFIVLIGVVELWVGPLIQIIAEGSGSKHNWTWVEFMRLLRLLRLLWFIRIFPMAVNLIKGFGNMLQSFAMTFMVLLTFTWIHAVICTHFLGQGRAFGKHGDHGEAVSLIEENFHSTTVSLFTLFRITTTDDWFAIAHPLIELDSRWMLLFIEFILFASWTMISVLTAVASDSMVAAASDRQEAQLRLQEVKRQQFREFLSQAFRDADVDQNNMLDKQEFNAMMTNQRIQDLMAASGATNDIRELEQNWEMLDIDGSGTLTIDEFVVGLGYLQEGLSTKHVLNSETEIKRLNMKAEQWLGSISLKMENMRRTNIELLAHLREQERDALEQLHSLSAWTQRTAKLHPSAFPPHVMVLLDPVESLKELD